MPVLPFFCTVPKRELSPGLRCPGLLCRSFWSSLLVALLVLVSCPSWSTLWTHCCDHKLHKV